MRLAFLCGMPWEVSVLRTAVPGALVLSGTDKLHLAELLPRDITHLACAGLCGGLYRVLKVTNFALASSVVDGVGGKWTPDASWNDRIVEALRAIRSGPNDAMTPPWVRDLAVCPWYSSGKLDEADDELQREELFARTGAWAIDDEVYFAAQEAERRGIPFVDGRALSDAAGDPVTETLPLAMRGQIMTATGSADLEYFLKELKLEPLYQTLNVPGIVADFNASLEVLSLAAPAFFQALL